MERLLGRRLEEVKRGSEVNTVALGPAVRTIIPIDRHAGVSPIDAGVQEYRQQAVEVRRAPE